MYKVVSLSLSALFGVALLFSLLDILSYTPLAMAASLAVLVAATYVTSLVFGLLFNVRVHGESSLITALILFFIFTPTLEVNGLLTLAIVGFIAGASKFILAFRGRHLFNPVAVAAFGISLTGLGYASWWVATPPLIFFTLLFGFLVIHKTRRPLVTVIFTLTSIAIILATLLLEGNTVNESAMLLLSWPIFFFAAFMLTEPLTLSPKKWQQVVEAVIVAVLFAVPLHIGETATGPAFALLVGNLIAFAFRRQPNISLVAQMTRKLAPTSYEITFKPTKKIRYEAGQYLELSMPHKNADLRGARRSFSITSAPSDEMIRIGVKFYQPSSSFKKALRSIKKGVVVKATSINGEFTLPKDPTVPLLFVAGGIGITPFISHIRHLQSTGQRRDIVLLYAVSSTDEIAYKDVLRLSGIKVIIVTPEAFSFDTPAGWTVVSQPYISLPILRKYGASKRRAYISGPPMMIDSAKKHMKKLKVKHIKTDYFIGY